jgi:hypothetical protein
MIWTAALGDWVPARTVPALGLAQSDEKAATAKSSNAASEPAHGAPSGFGLAIASFILGLVGLVTGPLFFIVSAIVASARGSQDALGLIFLTMWFVWGMSSLLAVIFGPIGMARIARGEGRRRGYGLAVTGLVLGILGLVGFLALLFIAALGMIAVAGLHRN